MKTIDELGISPAPWKVFEEGSESAINEFGHPFVVKENNESVAHTTSCCHEPKNIRRGDADARLIAAAPDLYEALYETARFFRLDNGLPYSFELGTLVDKIHTALAKAGGSEAKNDK